MIPRYTRPEMGRVWAPERRFRIWLDVELAACEAMVRLGDVPPEDYEALRKAFDGFEFRAEDVARIDEIERTVKHDVIAFLTFVEERGGPAARHLHRGMTSSDVLDTTLAVQLKEATALILAGIDRTMAAVKRRALEHRRTPMMGRSHGIHAEPITFGLKLAGWYDAWARRRDALGRAGRTVAVGKISGAVGTFANVDPRVEAFVMERLGLEGGEGAATQVVNRDRHAEYFAALAVAGSTLEQHATEVRHLQRTEVREAEEPFTAGQKGSSAMPHKRNPILSENLTGLARLLRSYALAALEDVALWHERDISHSSVERVALPDATTLLHYMQHLLLGVVEGMRVYPERMRANVELTHGALFSQAVLTALIESGMTRDDAYRVVQRNAQRAWEEQRPFRALVEADAEIAGRLDAARLDELFDHGRFVRHAPAIIARLDELD